MLIVRGFASSVCTACLFFSAFGCQVSPSDEQVDVTVAEVEEAGAGEDAEEPRETRIFKLVSQPAALVVESLREAMQAEHDLTIVSNEATNSLILRGTADSIETCTAILEALDQPVPMIYVDATVSIVPAGASSGQSENAIEDHLQIGTMNEVLAKVQLGQNVAVASGTVQSGPGKTSQMFQRQQFGTMMTVTPRVAGENISAAIQLEKSWLGKVENEDAMPTSHTITVDTTLSLTPGEPQTYRSKISEGQGAAMDIVITITASFKKPE